MLLGSAEASALEPREAVVDDPSAPPPLLELLELLLVSLAAPDDPDAASGLLGAGIVCCPMGGRPPGANMPIGIAIPILLLSFPGVGLLAPA